MAGKYRLYAVRTMPETMEKTERERFVRMTAGYTLLYRKTTPRSVPSVEIKGGDMKRLTDRDRLWLVDCAAVLAAERVKKNGEDTRKRLNRLLDEFERELAAAQERIGEEDTHGAEESDK